MQHATSSAAPRTCFTIRLGSVYCAIADVADCDTRPGVRWLTRLNVPPAYRRKGIATRLLLQVLAEMDLHGITLKLAVQASGDMTDEQLCQWYRRFGFVSSAEHERVMERKPRGCGNSIQ